MQDIEMITSEITLLLPHHPNYLSEYVSKIKQKKKKLKKSAGKKNDRWLSPFFVIEKI